MKKRLLLPVIIMLSTHPFLVSAKDDSSACERNGSHMSCKNSNGKAVHKIRYMYKTDIPVNQTLHNQAGAVIFAKSWCNEGPPKIEVYEERYDTENGSSRTGPLKKRYYWECHDSKRAETTLGIDGKGKKINCSRIPNTDTWSVDLLNMVGGREKWDTKVNKYGVSCPILKRPSSTNNNPVAPGMMTFPN